jgi:hypothetical protein
MASASSSPNRAARVFVVAVATGLVVVSVAFRVMHDAPSENSRLAASRAGLAESEARLAAASRPGIVEGSYHELARFETEAGEVSVFTATSKRNRGWHCVGLAAEGGFGMSCAPTPFATGLVRIHATTLNGTRYFSGIAAPSVARVVVDDNTGHRAPASIKGGAFVHVGSNPRTLRALNATGRVLETRQLHFSD